MAEQVERPLGHADQSHAVVDTTRAQARLPDHEAVALAGQQRIGVHADVAEHDLGVPLAVLVAEDRQRANDLDAGRVDGDDEH